MSEARALAVRLLQYSVCLLSIAVAGCLALAVATGRSLTPVALATLAACVVGLAVTLAPVWRMRFRPLSTELVTLSGPWAALVVGWVLSKVALGDTPTSSLIVMLGLTLTVGVMAAAWLSRPRRRRAT